MASVDIADSGDRHPNAYYDQPGEDPMDDDSHEGEKNCTKALSQG
jgi:hypothetical protein